jgi:uncharacterized membrane protein HdeD (DUF308 family)
MVLRKSITVELGLCDEHKAKHRRNVFITWALILLSVGSFILAVIAEDNTFALLGVLLLLAGIIVAVVAVRIVTAAKIDDKFAWLKGVNKDYLNELPQWPGA